MALCAPGLVLHSEEETDFWKLINFWRSYKWWIRLKPKPFWDRVLLSWQAGLELIPLLLQPSRVLSLQVYTTTPSFLSVFQDRVPLRMPGHPWTCNPPMSVSPRTGIVGVHHQAWLDSLFSNHQVIRQYCIKVIWQDSKLVCLFSCCHPASKIWTTRHSS